MSHPDIKIKTSIKQILRALPLVVFSLLVVPGIPTVHPGLEARGVPKGYFRPEFRDIEIRDFLKTMAQITGKNVLIDDSVKGKITIISQKNIPVTDALDFLKQVLEVRGFAILEEPNLIKVLQQDKVANRVIPEKGKVDPAGIVTRVIRLPYSVNLNEMSGFMKGILGNETKVATYKDNNSLVLTGYAPALERASSIIQELVPDLGKPEQGQGNTKNDSIHIYRVRNLPAESVAKVLVRLDVPEVIPDGPDTPDPAKQVRKPGNEKIKAVAHTESNSIIVTASSQEWQEILQIIERLDQVRKQILLEVLVAEITSTNINDFGIDWRYQSSDGPHTQFNSGLATEGNLVDTETGEVTGYNTLSGFSLGFLDSGGELLGIFNANVSNQNFNVLSAPQILTLDNQEAEINVGQDVPVQTQARTSGGGTSTATINSYEYRPAGIKLKFTPHVSADENISIDLFTEVTNIEGGQTSATNPTFNKRNVKTYVNVQNKQTIVIGGLVSTERLQSVQKIPLLGDIPLLGFMFRRTTWSTKKTNLMIFLTPHILDRKTDADRISRYKRAEQIRTSRERNDDTNLWPEPDRSEE